MNERLNPERIKQNSPKAHGLADGCNPAHQKPGPIQTAVRRQMMTSCQEYAALNATEAHSALRESTAKIDGAAGGIDIRGFLETTKNDLQQLHEEAKAGIPQYAGNLKNADKASQEFLRTENRGRPAQDAFDPNRSIMSLTLPVGAIMLVEATALAIVLGPYAAGGYLETVFISLGISAVYMSTAVVFSAFALRAHNYSNPRIRRLANICLVVAPLLALITFALAALYRMSIESGRPFGHFAISSNVVALFAVSVIGWAFAAWKVRGGSKLPWTTYYGEAPPERNRRQAETQLHDFESHWRSEIDQLVTRAQDTIRSTVSKDQEELRHLAVKARDVDALVGKLEQAAHDHHVETLADLQKYESSFKEVWPHATFEPFLDWMPTFPNSAEQHSQALARAAGRLAQNRDRANDLDGYLAHLREEALTNLNEMFTQARR